MSSTDLIPIDLICRAVRNYPIFKDWITTLAELTSTVYISINCIINFYNALNSYNAPNPLIQIPSTEYIQNKSPQVHANILCVWPIFSLTR